MLCLMTNVSKMPLYILMHNREHSKVYDKVNLQQEIQALVQDESQESILNLTLAAFPIIAVDNRAPPKNNCLLPQF